MVGHEFRAQSKAGAVIYRVDGLTVHGFTIMSLAYADEPDRFATVRGMKVALTENAASLPRLQRQPAVFLDERMRRVLGQPHLLVAKRRFQLSATARMIARPLTSWRWEQRATLLDRLEVSWSLAESVADETSLHLLKRKNPLGVLADLCFEDFEGDSEYQEALRLVNLDRARDDFREVSERLDSQLTFAGRSR